MISTRLNFQFYKQIRQNNLSGKTFFSEMPFTKSIKNNDTDLHLLARYCISTEKIYHLINENPAEFVVKMAMTTNDLGKTPLDDIFENSKMDVACKKDIVITLLKMIIKHQNVKPLSELLCVDEILKSYYSNSSPELLENIKLACEIVNDVRRIILFSSTHPDFNHLEKGTRDEIIRRIKKITSILKSDLSFCTVENMHSLVRRFQAANCGDASVAAIYFLQMKSTKALTANRLHLQNGDHSIIIFGSGKLPDPNSYSNINTDVVFCDPHLGCVGKFYRDDIIRHLGSSRKLQLPDQSPAHFIVSFNPNYHRFYAKNTWDIQPVKKNTAMLKLFDTDINKIIYVEDKLSSNKLIRMNHE